MHNFWNWNIIYKFQNAYLSAGSISLSPIYAILLASMQGVHHSNPGIFGRYFCVSLHTNDSTMPCKFLDGDVCGRFRSAWASIHMTHMSGSALACPCSEPIDKLWSPPRTIQVCWCSATMLYTESDTCVWNEPRWMLWTYFAWAAVIALFLANH